jgi:bifunctional non-homologous end joining protein LigD
VASAAVPCVFITSPACQRHITANATQETKLDGYRAIVVVDSSGKARIWSRNHLPLEPKFPTFREAVNQLKLRSTILDGEIVALDDEGVPRFQLLQQWPKRPIAPVVYYLFDLLWSDGHDLIGKSIVRRRERLEQVITPVPGIQVGGYVEERGKDLFQLTKERGLEGIIAKRKTSIYRPGERSPDWLKIKSRPQQEFVVCGFTEGKGSRKHFGALLLCSYRSGKLRYFGHSGTGFSEKGLAEAIDRLRPFFTGCGLSLRGSPIKRRILVEHRVGIPSSCEDSF